MNPGARRVGLLVLAAITIPGVALGIMVLPWSELTNPARPGISAHSLFSASYLEHARSYYLPQRYLGLLSLLVTTVLILVLGFTRLGPRLMVRLPGPWWSQTLIGCFVIQAMTTAVVLPIKLWLQLRATRFGLVSGGIRQWLIDLLVGLVTNWVFTAIPVLLLILLVRRAPKWWPALAALTLSALVVMGSFLSPLVIEPLFNKFHPLADPGLKAGIQSLAATEQVSISQVLVADASRRTTTLNAYVSGFGSTRRVVLYDTLLKQAEQPEVLGVVAHELAHARHRDYLIGTMVAAGGVAAGMGLLPLLLRRWQRPPDATLVPRLLALGVLASLAVAPIQNGLSRAMETRADRDAVIATKDPKAYELMQIRLARASLSDPDPPRILSFWFATHPSTVQRVAAARSVHLDQRL
ncbi:MAG TPA: M48 family metalloprotease [Marmoricola sp.]|nr:M48 family metalloprotease [Marmoricola sp.]HNO38833.1 M48 family metalloprotease [Marmoricola sp.]